jgi:hypothetical protein
MRRKQKSCFVFWSLFGVLEVKDGLNRTGKKKKKKMATIACMQWSVLPDALPGSTTLVRVLDRWLNDCVSNAPAVALPD